MAIFQASFMSECLKRKVHFNAILPTDPVLPGAVRLPLKTAYLLHGYTGSGDSWFTRNSLGALSQRNNLAIILPDAENHFYIDDTQRDDLYGEYIGRELVEFTRGVFPLSKAREDTIIGGLSMGGYGALLNGLKYNEIFGHVIAISPALILNELYPEFNPSIIGTTPGYYESVFGDLSTAYDRDVNLFWLTSKMSEEGARFPGIYIACGSNDRLVFESRRLDRQLTDLGIAHVYDEDSGTHDDFFFQPHMEAGFARIDLDRPPEPVNPFWTE